MSEKTVCCPRDGYVWTTKSKMIKVTCPSCGYKCDLEANRIRDEFLNLQHFNVDEKGVKILDKGLTQPNSPNGVIVEVYFKKGKAWCDYDNSDNCIHVAFAMNLSIVQEIFKKKGWKL